ncbi:MAG: energy-coupling factor ABC transporter permease [Nevskiales bacterium]|nr:energy-coupling factor ABC transporter permease [Nevskiales bacterium]
MTVSEALLSPTLFWLMSLAQGVMLAACVATAPWRSVWRVPERWHLLFGAAVGLLLLWQVSGRITPHVHLHLLGMTTVTLMLGPQLAILAGSFAALGAALTGQAALPLVLVNGLLNATLPALVTAALLKAALHYGPRNLFIYMLGVGFGGGALSMLAVLSSMLLLFALAGEARGLREWASPLLLLAMFPEGFVNGAVVSALAVYKPHWLQTYDDHYFLDGV